MLTINNVPRNYPADQLRDYLSRWIVLTGQDWRYACTATINPPASPGDDITTATVQCVSAEDEVAIIDGLAAQTVGWHGRLLTAVQS